MQVLDPFTAWNCASCKFHNAFRPFSCGKCYIRRDLFFMCPTCQQGRPTNQESYTSRQVACSICDWKGQTDFFLVMKNAVILSKSNSLDPVIEQSSTQDNKLAIVQKKEKKTKKVTPFNESENELQLAIALSISSATRTHVDRKKWLFDEKHVGPPFSSWQCSCGFPNQGRKVNLMYLNDWKQVRLVCSGCKAERSGGQWRCTKEHIVALKPIKEELEPSAHECQKCGLLTRSITIWYPEGLHMEKEEEEMWAHSLRYR